MWRSVFVAFAVLLGQGCLPNEAAQGSIVLSPLVSSLQSPVGAAHAGDGSGRLFILEQAGRIRVFQNGALLPEPFLDIAGRVRFGGEQGLLGLAFHPDFAANGFFFVNYTDSNGDTVVARYRLTADGAKGDPGSESVILHIEQPFGNHNGGKIAFGRDGFLYIGMGDGGSGGDPGNRAQNLGTLLGKMLRLDVDGASPYAIPPDNPFVSVAGARVEIWALGLRNPWRFTFDRATGDLFIGDVGQNMWEEINHQPGVSRGGENYGWRRMEGFHCFNPSSNCNDGSLTLPILEYDRGEGCSVSGGYRYRGNRIAGLQGAYLFGDYCAGTIWAARQQGDGSWHREVLLRTSLAISSFAEDEAGEVHVVDHRGGVYRIEQTPARRRAVQR
ncbi:MAG TPA: PQQ-dependent sugar dehydrogenase [Thermoanaerobaculia bacterium]|nr:PQQ-dependent sugar dehydrogenase [Thermoanaerobaculia bacterium]